MDMRESENDYELLQEGVVINEEEEDENENKNDANEQTEECDSNGNNGGFQTPLLRSGSEAEPDLETPDPEAHVDPEEVLSNDKEGQGEDVEAALTAINPEELDDEEAVLRGIKLERLDLSDDEECEGGDSDDSKSDWESCSSNEFDEEERSTSAED